MKRHVFVKRTSLLCSSVRKLFLTSPLLLSYSLHRLSEIHPIESICHNISARAGWFECARGWPFLPAGYMRLQILCPKWFSLAAFKRTFEHFTTHNPGLRWRCTQFHECGTPSDFIDFNVPIIFSKFVIPNVPLSRSRVLATIPECTVWCDGMTAERQPAVIYQMGGQK